MTRRSPHSDPLRWAGPLLVFLLALALFGALFLHFPVLYDTDSYYHLAIARVYASQGVVDTLPWARLSLLHEFGDKEVLFHLLLAPFAGSEGSGRPGSTAGGRWALALLNALVAAVLAALGMAAAGRWGLLVPLLVYGGSIDFLGRAIRLRPELLSLVLLLAAAWCASRRRFRLLGLVAALYALSYTAFHAFLGLAIGWFLVRLWARRRWEWGLVLYPVLGLGLGLVVHPHFPQNLVVWKVQSVDYFQHKEALNVGLEIGPHSAPDLVWLNLAWLLGLLALWRSGRSAGRPSGAVRDQPAADVFAVAAAAFGVLYLLMLRFSVYFIPFATLALLFELRRRGRLPGRSTALPWRGRMPLVLALAAALALGVPRAALLLDGLASARGPVEREDDWQAFGRRLPPGARVAAEWGSTHLYMFWAPQATFLNVLDPVFMNVRYPEAYRALRAIFEDREPDVPRALRQELASDYLALSLYHQPQSLLRRLAGDPRLRLRYRGYTLLYETVPGANAGFVVDWRVVPQGTRVPPAAAEIADLEAVPRPADPALQAVEGYVDAGHLAAGPADCVALVHVEETAEAATRLYQLAPYGPTRLWLDDELVIASGETPRAYLESATAVPLRLTPGSHRITVLTCPGRDGSGRSGFYLRHRPSGIDP